MNRTEYLKQYEEKLRALSDEKLVEKQKAQWTIGAADDEEWIAKCVPIKDDQHRREVINFLVECELNYWAHTQEVPDDEAQANPDALESHGKDS